jgi:2,3-dihydroxyphenylpropionate 1,2-dioxygenase
MADLVAALGISHTAFMVRAWSQASVEQRDRIDRGVRYIRTLLNESRASALVLIGNDHFQSFHLENMPAFCIVIARACETAGDGGVPPYHVEVDYELAEELLNGVLDDGFTPAFSTDCRLDHAFATPLHFLTPAMDIPIVAIYQNCNAPPRPPLRTSVAWGRALRRALINSRLERRVIVIGTGGLSHSIPLPDWRLLKSENPMDAAMLAALTRRDSQNSRENQANLEAQIARWGKHQVGKINEEFDRWFLALLEAGKVEDITKLSEEELSRDAGNGGHEIRNWLTMVGIAGEKPTRTLFYEAVHPWLTGIAGAVVDLS